MPRARVPRIRSDNSGFSALMGVLQERREAPQREREEAREEAEFQSQLRQRGLNEALHLLSLGNKQGAADILTRLNVTGLTRDVTTRGFEREVGPGEDPGGLTERIPFVTTTRQESTLETPRERFEREGAMTEARESRGRRETFEFGQQSAEAAETRLRDRPPPTTDAFFAGLLGKVSRGETLTPGEQQAFGDVVDMRRDKQGATARIVERADAKLRAGEPLLPHEQQVFDSQFQIPDVGAKRRAEGREEERLGLERQRVQESRAARGETQEFREESRATNERNRVFNELDRARQTVEKKFERRRETVSLGTNRQQALAQLDTQEDAELAQITERMKKLHPKFAPDIDAAYGGSTRPAQRPSILDFFNQPPKRRGTPGG